ncbi:MAG: undecaprenyldiphospho-muramoylpentapeptide beta-N-acetylglucosaminyltransferase [Pseudobdellovibrionaceae bacterium]
MKKVIMIAGGGTGGHIYPGLAIARALQKLDPNVEIQFVGTAQGLESKIVSKEKIPIHLIHGGQLNFAGNPLRKLKTLIKLPLGLFQSFALILKHNPSFVLGVGGYASGPFLLAAVLLGKKTAIWEANAYPGMANRWLAQFVQKCFLVFEDSKALLKNPNSIVFGMPVRAEMEKEATHRPRSDEKFHLLHYGGSQGSRIIGRNLHSALKKGGAWTENLKVVHQTGALDHADFLERYKGFESLVEVHEFIYNMPDFYEWADLVVCRGGASTLNELAAFGLPAIVIPLPAADGHQEKNAEMLVKAEAARMILQKDLTPEKLINEIETLRQNPALREKLKANIRKFHRPKAAEAIAKAILET